MLITRHKVINAQAQVAYSLQRTYIQSTSIIYQNHRYCLPHGIYSDMQRVIVVLPLLGKILVRIGNNEFLIYGPNHIIQILEGCGCRDFDLVEKVY